MAPRFSGGADAGLDGNSQYDRFLLRHVSRAGTEQMPVNQSQPPCVPCLRSGGADGNGAARS